MRARRASRCRWVGCTPPTRIAAVAALAALAALAACAPAGARLGQRDGAQVGDEPVGGAAQTPGDVIATATTRGATVLAATVTDQGAAQTSAAGAAASVPAPPTPGWAVNPASSTKPWPGARTTGLLTFRGNPTRSFYGTGPMPGAPGVLWRFPTEGALCSESYDGEWAVWCGTGWTGQPAVWETPAGTRVAFGAFDGAVHVLDASSGRESLGPLLTGDLVKGSVTIDPDGYPLAYVGSRDNLLRVIALDRGDLTTLWQLPADAVTPVQWNDDWDGSPLVRGDLLIEGGENSQLHVVKLNRRFGRDGKVTVAPRLVFHAPSWDDQLTADAATSDTSVESSVALVGTVAYFANSAGLVQGWDLARALTGAPGATSRTFRFWMGDDTDASVVADDEGYLYVAAEYERGLPRADEVGQLVKLDPRRPDAPLVWSLPLRAGGVPSGAWATPALHRDTVIVADNSGLLSVVDRATGALRATVQLTGPTWSSPVVVDDVLVQGDCAGVLHGFSVADTTIAPRPLWTVQLDGCIESTPAVWQGRLYVGTRAGAVYAIGAGDGQGR